MERFSGRVAVVTGGALNTGRAISLRLASEGARVWIFDTDQEGAQETVELIRGAGGDAQVRATDVTARDDVDAAVAEVLAKDARIDVLVNNVGGSFGGGLEEVDEAILDRNVALNLKSAFFCTRAVVPGMCAGRRGSVVFVSSLNALFGGFGEIAYSAAKSGLHSLARSLTAEYSPRGVRFNVLCIGSIPAESRMWARREQEHPGTFDRLADLYPLGRVGAPDDVAAAAAFLASDDAGWITGVVLPVDGGFAATAGLAAGDWWTNEAARM